MDVALARVVHRDDDDLLINLHVLYMSPALWSAAGALNSPHTIKKCSVRLNLLVGVHRQFPQRRHGHHARSYASTSTDDGSLSKHGYNDVLDEAVSVLGKLVARGKGRDAEVQIVEGFIRARERLREGTSTPRVTGA